jgi:hypothetical protein
MKSMPSPRTALDSAAFEKLRRIAPNFLAGQHAARSGEWQARPVPEEVAFKLTNRCDLVAVRAAQVALLPVERAGLPPPARA